MLTPEQKKVWRRLDGLTGGLIEFLELEASDMALCHLAVMREIREAMRALCPPEDMYGSDQGGAA
ncbi:MAG TPA: hypothetical protein H9874_02750 [Candidatus Bilophila faecipullorum]|uniref:Uncharacterized protein n=1 Tax=Candidatus Bilophila faecipullorum TaxID=2838482 RepID=A0A9D1QZI8_9BACT|nr:hypothetical protein [Candidatus Bilophila faecipullorum]